MGQLRLGPCHPATGKAKIKQEYVQNLLYAADFFSLDGLKSGCAEFLADNFDNNNVLGMYFLGQAHVCDELECKAKDWICENFSNVVDSSEFAELTPEQISDVLSFEWINFEETVIFNSAIKWLQHDLDKRKNDIYDVFSQIRYIFLPRFFFYDKVMSNPHIVRDSQMKCLLDEVVHFNMLKERWVEFDLRLEPRMWDSVRYVEIYMNFDNSLVFD